MLGEVREVFLHFQSLCHSFSGYHSPIRRPSTSTNHQTNGGAGGKQTFVVDGRTDADVADVVVTVTSTRRRWTDPWRAYWLPMNLFVPIDNWFPAFIQQNWIGSIILEYQTRRESASQKFVYAQLRQAQNQNLPSKAPNDTFRHSPLSLPLSHDGTLLLNRR